MDALPANLPNIASAKLPAVYENAKTALTECSRIDECADWSDKAAALASYAKQAGDSSLHKMAIRIQARAIERCGELLKAYDGRGGDRSKTEGAHGSAPPTQREAAAAAGLSEHQQLQAVRVANVPREEFEQQVESDDPPTVTELAEQGKKLRPAPATSPSKGPASSSSASNTSASAPAPESPAPPRTSPAAAPKTSERLIDLQGRDPKDFQKATQGHGDLRLLAEFCRETDAATIARGTLPDERADVRRDIATITVWLTDLDRRLEA